MVSARQIFVLVLAAAFVPVVASAQSLGEIAAKERQRREAQKKAPAKVMTEADLEKAKGSSANVGVGANTAAPTPEGSEAKPAGAAAKPGEKSEAEKRIEEEEAWRKKLTDAESRLKAELEAQETLQRDVNDPNLGYYSQSRQTIQNLLDESQKKVAAAQTEIAALENEGREKAFSR